MDGAEGSAPLTLKQNLAIALLPSSVPALVLLIALGLAVGIGALPEALGNAFEQIAGGALLITYMKELLPKVMEQGDAAVAYLAGSARKSLTRTKVVVTLLMVSSIAASAIAQAAAAGFPGMKTGSDAEATSFTPAMTIAYFIGFFVDGVVLAYDDTPVKCDLTLVKKMVMSLVFAIDNLLDGFGLCPVLKEAFGEDDWWIIMIVFSACVIAGAIFTACLRYFIPHPVFHLVFLSAATTSILVGALELISHGLSVYVMVGIAAVWVVLFVGDLVSEADEADDEDVVDAPDAADAPTPIVRRTSLALSRHSTFVNVAQGRRRPESKWRVNTAALIFAARANADRHTSTLPAEVTPAQTLRERLTAAAVTNNMPGTPGTPGHDDFAPAD